MGFGQDPYARHNDGCFVSVYNVEHFRPLKQFKQDVAGFAQFMKDSPPAPGFNSVLYPGEIEHLTEQTRRRDGIYVEDSTWNEITSPNAVPGHRQRGRLALKQLGRDT